MRKVIIGDYPETVQLKEIQTAKYFAYEQSSGSLHVLSRMGQTISTSRYGKFHYGFVNLGHLSSNASFLSDTVKTSVEKALSRGRNVMQFDTLSELLMWKLKIR